MNEPPTNSSNKSDSELSTAVLRYRLKKYIKVRWIFLIILSVSGLLTQYISERFTGTILKNLLVSLSVLALNEIFQILLKRFYNNHRKLKVLAAAIIMADILASAFLVYSNGGIEARTIIIFAIPMIAVGAFFKSKTVYALALLASILYDSVLILDYMEVIPRVVINAPAIHSNFGSVLVATIFYPATFFMVAFVADYVMTLLSEREAQLQARSKELTMAQEIANIGSWEWDMETNKITWSDQLYRIYGLTPNEFKASFQAFIKLVHPADRKKVQTIVKNAATSQQPFNFEHRILLKDGTIRVISAQGQVFTDNLGKSVKMQGTGQDITLQHKNRQELLKQNSEMAKLNALMVNRELKMIELKQKIKELTK